MDGNIKFEINGNVGCLTINGDATEEEWNKVNEIMDVWQDEMITYMQQIAEELGVSQACADAIIYLRSRSRYTPEMEQKLIEMDKNGEAIPYGDIFSGEWSGI